MKLFLLVLLSSISLFLLPGCQSREKHETHASVTVYTCPMHPAVRETSPGICPICKMDLVPVGQQNGSDEIALTAAQEKLAGIKLITGDSLSKADVVWIPARIEANHETTNWITLKLPGRIDWLLTREKGVKIAPGQVIARVYSEQFETLQRELLLNLSQKEQFPAEPRFSRLLDKAIRKMELYEVSNKQVQALIHTRKTLPYLEIIARQGGIIQEVRASLGNYLETGAPLMILENYTSLLAEASISPALLRNIHENATLLIELQDGQKLNGHIHQVLPELATDNNGRFLVMIEHPLPGMLPGQFVKIAVPSGNHSGIWIPSEAVIRSEKDNWVWTSLGNGHYAPKKVELGSETSSHIQILSGISGKEQLVGEGAYLLYSEMQLQQHTHQHQK